MTRPPLGLGVAKLKGNACLRRDGGKLRHRVFPNTPAGFAQLCDSVQLQLYHLDIDLVPAIQNQSNPQFIRIPDSSASQWINSSPMMHSEKAASVNSYQNGKFKPLVKLLKYWNGNLPGIAHLKSFAIETIAVRGFQNFQFGTLQEGLKYFFDFIAHASGGSTVMSCRDKYGMSLSWLTPNVPDTAGTGSNVAACSDGERRKQFVEHAIRSRDKIVDSLNTIYSDTAYRRITEALKM